MCNFPKHRQEKGIVGEYFALKMLEDKGFSVLGKNIRFNVGEIDILAVKGNVIYLVEVKSIVNNSCVDPVENLNPRKIRKLKLLASFIESYGLSGTLPGIKRPLGSIMADASWTCVQVLGVLIYLTNGTKCKYSLKRAEIIEINCY